MHDEEVYIRLQDRSLELIESRLTAEIDDLAIEELWAIEDFINHIGGVENAYLAIDALKRLDSAA